MKILLGVVYYEPAWAYGGPPKLVFELARRLLARGHEVTVCTTDALSAEARAPRGRYRSHGVDVVRFPNLSNTLAYRSKIFLPLGLARWARAHVGRFDVVHLFDARTPLNGWLADAALAAGVPFFLSVWGQLPLGEGWRAAVKRLYDRRYLRRQLSAAAGLLAQNDHEAQLYRAHGATAPVALWPLAVELDELTDPPPRGTFRRARGIADDEQVVLFVGRLHALKGVDVLLRAFAQVAADRPRARLVIVGRDDGDQDRLEGLARDLRLGTRVIFTGGLYGPDVLPAYVDCDLFCITPTHYEETSLASLTACALGHPVLINDRCGIPWLAEYDAGIVASDADLPRAMGALLDDPRRLAQMGAGARRLVHERFSWDSVVVQAEALYRGATARRAA